MLVFSFLSKLFLYMHFLSCKDHSLTNGHSSVVGFETLSPALHTDRLYFGPGQAGHRAVECLAGC